MGIHMNRFIYEIKQAWASLKREAGFCRITVVVPLWAPL